MRRFTAFIMSVYYIETYHDVYTHVYVFPETLFNEMITEEDVKELC